MTTAPQASVIVPSPSQVALDLTCALAASGKFNFTADTPEGRLHELFSAFNALSKTLTLSTNTKALAK